MTSIITGDIINSRKVPSEAWIEKLKALLHTFGENPTDWEIYRGDEFQLEVHNPEEALLVAIEIKALLKSLKMDVRMSIGIGDKKYTGKKISESNGTAFIHSGESFETLKKQKTTLTVNSGTTDFDKEMNLMLRLALTIMDHWLQQSAEFVITTIRNQSLSQEEIGMLLNINQAAVSRRRSRANFDLIMEVDAFYAAKIKTLTV
ncbi:hypothetical protein [Flavobacterium kingsejongi]|uniref:Uncharacterized protein n=1 Tax=Flavobacterium kingsejongi TaxID=1678728 RepID=A0A2S1LQ24_9FLAO|nr:hypothetical protein [Flavobacterium kingsejongi]AWG25746.1 hypothetical protein FK004_11210 [Flavobacterium kingsejongi]